MIRFGPETEIIHALPVASAIRRAVSPARLVWVTDEVGVELLEGYEDIDVLHAWKRKEWIRDFPYPHRTIPVVWEMVMTLLRLRRDTIDVVLDLQGSALSAFIGMSSGCTHRIGVQGEGGLMKRWSPRIAAQPEGIVHDVERNLSLLREMGIEAETTMPKLMIPQEARIEADTFFAQRLPFPDRPVIGIYPGADYTNRCWGADHYARVADAMTEKLGMNCLILWFPGERGMVTSIERRMRSVPLRAYPARGKSMLALIGGCSFIIAGDSAIIQMAGLMHVPVLGLYGPTASQARGPRGTCDRVIQGTLPCVPCGRLYCASPACMDTIQVEDVVHAAEQMLESYVLHARKRNEEE
ncbi:MAG: glycosyltransferase family 9 protein [bacterium]